ncbi:thymidine kinase [Eubacterium brachy ATCC 33089]|nr:thymidine kinase [Eubacterium brachy ATCC 33089]
MICKRIGESMAQLFFKYSTMNAGKSIELIKVAYNYEERGKRVFCLTPKVDSRYGEGVIASRVGLQRTAVAISEDMDILEVFMRENEKQPIDCVLVDEGQFLKKHHVEELVEIVDSLNVPVMVYGLKNDFKNELFEGSYYLLVYADKIEEIKTICWCGRKATMVARVEDGKLVKEGKQIIVGGNNMYVSLCRKHYNDGRISDDEKYYGYTK